MGPPWHNLWATRQTELSAEFPLHVVCYWMGNKQAVAAEHYLQVTEEDFRRGAKSGAVAVHFSVQHDTAPARTESQESAEGEGGCEVVREGARVGDSVRTELLPPRGLEPLS
jgi:hypothetical protein